MGAKGKRCSASMWSMLALAGIAIAGCTVVFADRSETVQNTACIMSCTAVAAVIVHRLHRASDVVAAALRLAEEMARLGRELPDGAAPREQSERASLAVVVPLPGQRAAVGQGLETPWFKDRQ